MAFYARRRCQKCRSEAVSLLLPLFHHQKNQHAEQPSSYLNAFALLGLEARPWLEPDAVRERAVSSSVVHEGKPGSLGELDEARKILVEPRLRLRHLLELTCPDEKFGVGPTTLPSVLTKWFEEATALEEKLNAFLSRKNAAASPLSRALLAREAMTIREEAETWLARLTLHEVEWMTALREFDARWQGDDLAARSCEVLALFAQTFAYLGRWHDTVRDRAFALVEM